MEIREEGRRGKVERKEDEQRRQQQEEEKKTRMGSPSSLFLSSVLSPGPLHFAPMVPRPFLRPLGQLASRPARVCTAQLSWTGQTHLVSFPLPTIKPHRTEEPLIQYHAHEHTTAPRVMSRSTLLHPSLASIHCSRCSSTRPLNQSGKSRAPNCIPTAL